jgi:hypothetical protein
VGFGQHCDTGCMCVWVVDSIVILSGGVCVGCGHHCDIDCWCED